MMKFLLCISVVTFIWSCSRSPYAATNRTYKKQAKQYAKVLAAYPLKDSAQQPPFFAGTTNFSMRRPNFVVIHHTAQNSCEQTLKTFTLPRTQVSAHYVICKDGTVHHMLNDLLRAHHAGVSKWGNNSDINSSSIGIEIDNNGYETFSTEQINSLLFLLERLKKAYSIPTANFIGHADVAPGRKVDPNRNFPWQQLAQKGFGYWYDTTAVQVPVDFNYVQALRIIGYTIQKPEAAIGSFKLHFVPADSSATISDADKKILVSLQKLYQ
jgi:N-acetylmuramoyl-L-alanine amidase